MNQAVQRMLEKYHCQTRPQFERALKEILQELALVGLWRARFFEHAAFYGGTALRILYGLDRFSEDLDFTLLKPDPNFSLSLYNSSIRSELEAYGFDVEIDTQEKVWQTPIQSAFIKTNTLGELLKIGIPAKLVKGFHPQSLLKIKFEIDTDPPPAYRTEIRFLNAPISIGVKTVVLEDIFAGKMHAVLFREWKGRVKGRDWYDWLWLLREGVKLDLETFSIHLRASGFLKGEESISRKQFDQLMFDKIASLDLESARADLKPFVADSAQITDWSKEMFRFFVGKIQTL
ncbi:MAG: nucleotidyl transferase AbiEii/AbiGii toxin family protein [Parachlamydiaceae bacterium]